jgi:hypothetical protein
MSIYTTAKHGYPELQALVQAYNGDVTVCKPGKMPQRTFRQRGTWEAMAAKNGAPTFVPRAQRASNYNPDVRG